MKLEPLIIRDPLYEEFELPMFLRPLLFCWEVQRLRNVRLINVNSLPLSSLGEASRYSHTLGVLKLGLVVLETNNIKFDDFEARLLLTALLLHDLGTPAFGHSLEYVLMQRSGRNHVDTAVTAISGESARGTYLWSGAPASGSHAKLRSAIKDILGADFVNHCSSALQGKGPIGHLVSSATIDLDNIDNVFRMANALGLRNWKISDPIDLSRALSVTRSDGKLTLRLPASELIATWATVRKSVYEILNLHPENLAGLAMLREAFEMHLKSSEDFGASAWWTVDSEILDSLTAYTKPVTDRIKRGDIYHCLLTTWIDTSIIDLRSLERLANHLGTFSDYLSEVLDHRLRVHAVLDNSTFSRKIEVLTHNDSSESFGTSSRGIIISVFSKSSSNSFPAREKVYKALFAALYTHFGVDCYLLARAERKIPSYTKEEFPNGVGQPYLWSSLGA